MSKVQFVKALELGFVFYANSNIAGVKQPKDKGILLRDILEGKQRSMVFDIPNPETARKTKNYIQWDTSGKGYKSQQDLAFFDDGKFGTLPVARADSKLNIACGALRGRYKSDGKTSQKLELSNDDKTNTITSVQKDNVVVYPKLRIPESTKKGFIEVENGNCFDATQINSKTRRGRDMSKKSNTLMAGSMDYMRYEYPKYRKLTPVECERLQTVPDNFTKHGINENCETYELPKTARYKMLGNGWTIEVISHIFSSIKNGIQKPNYIKQMELF